MGKGQLYRSVAALFSDQSVLKARRLTHCRTLPTVGATKARFDDDGGNPHRQLARTRRTFARLAVRGSAQDRGAAQAQAQGRGDFRDRLRAVRPAAYRDVWRSRTHDDGAPRLPRADRRQGQDPADRVFRRHGRAAQSARQRAQQGDVGTASRQAADQGAGPVRHASKLRRAQQRAALRLPRPVRLRLRVSVLDRLLHVGPFRCRAAHGVAAFRGSDGGHAAVAARRARANLFALSADRSEDRDRAASAGRGARCQSGNHHLRKRRRAGDDARHRRTLQAAMEAGLGDALACARRRLRNGRQGFDRLGQAVGRNLPHARRRAAGRFQLRAFSRRERSENLEVEGQRSDHRRMAALRQPGKPVAVHVSRAESREAALFRRHPAPCRRLSAISRRLSAAGLKGAAGQSGLAYSRRRAAAARQSGAVRHAASRSSPRRMPRTPRRCGALSAAIGPA